MSGEIKDKELMNFPYYEFKSCIKDFKAAIDIANELRKRKEIYFLFKTIRPVKIAILIKEDIFSGRSYNLSFKDFVNICDNELNIFIAHILNETLVDIKNFRKWFMENIDDEFELDRYIEGHNFKFEYTEKFLIDDDFKKYYSWKKPLTDNRLLIPFSYSVNKRIMDKGNEIPFINLDLWSAPDSVGVFTSEIEVNSVINMSNKTSIVCDANDLDYLIAHLTVMRDELNDK